MQFIDRLIRQYIVALRKGDRDSLHWIEAKAAEYDAHNGTQLVDELAAIAQPAAA